MTDPSLDNSFAEALAEHSAGLMALQIQGLLKPDVKTGMDGEARVVFIKRLLGDSPDAEQRAAKLAALTQGMDEQEIRHLIGPDAPQFRTDETSERNEILKLIHTRKREIIETECFGLIEFLDARHDFSHVGGMTEVKNELIRVATHIREGNLSRVPMGLLLVGPMGTGKTFIAGAFARESGLTAVKLKNFRSKWVGSTEANLEKVLTIIRALGPIILIIDEGDRSFGDSGDGDGGTSSRVIARMKEFMGDPENRGRVLFILMTNRPDKLDLDIKRAGRLDVKIPLFYASVPADIESVLAAQFNRHGIEHAIEWPRDRDATSVPLIGYSNAELEAVVLLANNLAYDSNSTVTPDIFAQAVRDYLPTRNEAMLRYMELQAVFESSNRRMLPPKYRNMSNQELNRQLQEAKLAI